MTRGVCNHLPLLAALKLCCFVLPPSIGIECFVCTWNSIKSMNNDTCKNVDSRLFAEPCARQEREGQAVGRCGKTVTSDSLANNYTIRRRCVSSGGGGFLGCNYSSKGHMSIVSCICDLDFCNGSRCKTTSVTSFIGMVVAAVLEITSRL